MSSIPNKKSWKDALEAIVHQRVVKPGAKLTAFPKGVDHGPLTSKFFTTDADLYAPGVRSRLQLCANQHMAHISFGDHGVHVAWVKSALQDLVLPALDGYIPTPDMAPCDVFGAATQYCVLKYKRKNTIINRDYQFEIDAIIGIKTIRMLDAHLKMLHL